VGRFDLTKFWHDTPYAKKSYGEPKPSQSMVESVEHELGYVLPASYVSLMTKHNGGTPARTCFPTSVATSWARDHIAITGISAIGRKKPHSLCGALGSKFMIEEWGYPKIGVVFADCPSAGHDVIMFDYRQCKPKGEPSVVHVDQESDYKVTVLAKSFEAFIRGLVDESAFTDDDEEREDEELRKVLRGKFSPLLSKLCRSVTEVDDVEGRIRALAENVVEDKGHFSLHADPLSRFMYDVQLWLYTKAHPRFTRAGFLADYERILACAGEFTTGGYAPGFISDWFDARVKSGAIVAGARGLELSAKARAKIVQRLKATAAT